MNIDLIRAWKDDVYREGLTAQQRALVPENPAGAIELTEAELAGVDGALTPIAIGLTISLNYSVWFTLRNRC